MGGGGRDRGPEIGLRRHIGDRIMDQDDIEFPAEIEGAHVALNMFAVQVLRPADRQHVRREIG